MRNGIVVQVRVDSLENENSIQFRYTLYSYTTWSSKESIDDCCIIQVIPRDNKNTTRIRYPCRLSNMRVVLFANSWSGSLHPSCRGHVLPFRNRYSEEWENDTFQGTGDAQSIEYKFEVHVWSRWLLVKHSWIFGISYQWSSLPCFYYYIEYVT